MLEQYCVFLRGINVNGITIKMDELKEVFCDMGFTNVKTILATGNVIISVPDKSGNTQELKSSIEEKLSERFNYDAFVLLRSKKEIDDISTLSKEILAPENCHKYSILCDDKELIFELKMLFDATVHIPNEQFVLSKSGVFWIVPKGATLDSQFGSKVLGDKKYKNKLTSRNSNTIEKIVKSMSN